MSCRNINASTKHINERDKKAQNKLAFTVALDKQKLNLKTTRYTTTGYNIST